MTKTQCPDRRQTTVVISIAVLIFLLCTVVALQGGLLPREPAGQADFQGSLWQLIPLQMLQMFVLGFKALGILIPLWLSATGWGYPIRRYLLQKASTPFILQPAIGTALILLIAWASAWGGRLNQTTAWGLCIVGITIFIIQLLQPTYRHIILTHRIQLKWLFILPIPMVALFTVAAACPPKTLWSVEAFGYDTISYHLQLPRQWLEQGAMQGLPHNVYSYFPSLFEVGYMMIAAMQGSMQESIYTAQFYHASATILGAAILGLAVARRFGSFSGWISASALIAMPWTLIIGSSAYNEGFVLMMAASAVFILTVPDKIDWRSAVAAGFCSGAATMAKLTAGPMVALPITLIAMFRSGKTTNNFPHSYKRAMGMGALVCLAFTLVMSPYFIRNWSWTSNPVFPFATHQFGLAHWTQKQADNWTHTHAPKHTLAHRIQLLGRQWLFNVGHGALLSRPRTDQTMDIERFKQEGGVSALWVVALLGGVLLYRRPDCRPYAVMMMLMLMIQLGFWLFGTMQPSRYLYLTVLPGCALIGSSFGVLSGHLRQSKKHLAMATAIVLVAATTISSYRVFYRQTVQQWPPWQIIAIHDDLAKLHPINHLPPNTQTYMVADAMVLYVNNPVTYFTAFDVGPLSSFQKNAGGDPQTVTKTLCKNGYTHVWINWLELNRIRSTVSDADDLDAHWLARTAASTWRVLINNQHSVLYALPCRNVR